jgi:ABC-type phosphate transport system permease subunit
MEERDNKTIKQQSDKQPGYNIFLYSYLIFATLVWFAFSTFLGYVVTKSWDPSIRFGLISCTLIGGGYWLEESDRIRYGVIIFLVVTIILGFH